MARRLLPKEQLRERHVDVYLSQEELAAVQAKAQEAGLRLAEFVRACALSKRLQAVAAANPVIWASLAPTCSNLNQLAKHANEGRVTNIPPDLLIDLHEKVQALRLALLGEAS
jgi:hypothetical protein